MSVKVILILIVAAFGGRAASLFGRTDISHKLTSLIPGRSTCGFLLSQYGPTSCHNTTVERDSCCFNSPGGRIAQTQYWNYDTPLQFAGPVDSWTVHGLWPNNCDGTFQEFCDHSRQLKNITQILHARGEDELFGYMKANWSDIKGENEQFWDHEWNAHGTCISTLQTQCIHDYKPGDDVISWLKRTVSLQRALPTHDFLKLHSIVPSITVTYKLMDLRDAIMAETGAWPTIKCGGPGKQYVNGMWYFFETIGSVIDGRFVHVDSHRSDNCPDEVYYWPKGVPL